MNLASRVDRRVKRNLALSVLCGLVAGTAVLLATSRYGIGLSPDSAWYIQVARSLASGKSVPAYFTFQPPLYPAVLAVAGTVFSQDPIRTARWVNSALFGLIVSLAGRVFFERFPNRQILAFLGLSLVLFSRPVLGVAVMAWSESLAICFLVLGVFHLEKFLANGKNASLAIYVTAACLASLSRYIAVALIITGAVAILISGRLKIRERIFLSLLSTAMAALPLSIWAARNYRISGSFFGANHVSGTSTLQMNLWLTGSTIWSWFVPFHPTTIILIMVLFAVALTCWLNRRHTSFVISVWLLFVLVYTSMLITFCTISNFDEIGDRLLAPIYLPVVVLLVSALSTWNRLAEKFLPKTWTGTAMTAVVILLIIVPAKSFISSVPVLMRDGAGGFSTEQWRENETIAYVQHHAEEYSGKAYSNWPDALYLLAGIDCRFSPFQTFYHSEEKSADLSQLRGVWPDTSRSFLIWVDHKEGREFMFSDQDLQTIAQISPVLTFTDGTIYSVRRK